MPSFYTRMPEWLKIKLPNGAKSSAVIHRLAGHSLNTICTSGMCPNRAECWGAGTATFMIGGNICTRACRFCNVATGRPHPLDPGEIDRIASTIAEWKLRHVVVTSVDRDDLPDGGAAHWVALIRAVRDASPSTTIETLVPDFRGNVEALDSVIAERPEVMSHNLETVRRLTPQIRSVATYDGSLSVLRRIADAGIVAKSGIMLGLGETIDEVLLTMDDLRSAGCRVMTIGQYLQPTEHHVEVAEYVHPDVFDQLKAEGLKRGFDFVESAPLVRSSYHAERHVIK
ncbi:MAG: lipoyl synthase [Muribaculaceae bacterium]|nr:lipoyl synthase [Muribaculaceae bacterium]